MHIPHFWGKEHAPYVDKKGHRFNIECWGWSDTSVDEAIQKAREQVNAAVERLRRKWNPSGEDYYVVGGRPLREEIIRDFTGEGAASAAVITRNMNGCLVLNTDRAAFVDVDTPVSQSRSAVGGLLRRLLGAKPAPTEDQLQETALARLNEWISAHPGQGARIYRTRAGLRYLITHEPLDPEGDSIYTMMDALGADPLYMRLCRTHRCYRARLSAKPWRIGLDRPGMRYPYRDEAMEYFNRWLSEYEQAGSSYAVCQFVSCVGNESIHPDVAPWVDVHDEMSGAHTGLQLA